VLPPERGTTGHLGWFAAPLVLPGGVVAETCSRTDSADSGSLSTRVVPRLNGHAHGYCLTLVRGKNGKVRRSLGFASVRSLRRKA
jgi:hypothetical protein